MHGACGGRTATVDLNTDRRSTTRQSSHDEPVHQLEREGVQSCERHLGARPNRCYCSGLSDSRVRRSRVGRRSRQSSVSRRVMIGEAPGAEMRSARASAESSGKNPQGGPFVLHYPATATSMLDNQGRDQNLPTRCIGLEPAQPMTLLAFRSVSGSLGSGVPWDCDPSQPQPAETTSQEVNIIGSEARRSIRWFTS